MRKATINLTAQEEALCRLLDQTCSYINTTRPHIPEVDSTQFSGDGTDPCEARIAGGWVRDKLLARDSDDLDISLSTLTGNAFALYLKHYLSSSEFASSSLATSTYFQNDKSDMGRIGRIAANPEQSKSLETATARVLGLSLDFVNLRKETYDPGSRIPTMQFGTPKEDAERRDITINSLLYNVHTRQVEDHTGLGLADLNAGLIRTPLPPLTTFLDDPLRVLRCIRFASRFDYELHPSIVRCLTGQPGGEVSELASTDDPRISAGGNGIQEARRELRTALLSKVSRERFGIEVDKMIKGPNPLLALFLIHRLDMFDLIFHPPPSTGSMYVEHGDAQIGQPASNDVGLNAARLLDAILKQISTDEIPTHPVAMDTLRIGSAATESEQAKQVTGAFSALPPSPLFPGMLDSLPKDLLATWSKSSLTVEERRRVWYTVVMLPLKGLVYEEKKKKFAWAGESVIANGLKLGTKTLKEPVASLIKSIDLFRSGRQLLLTSQDEMQPSSTELESLLHLPPGLSVRSQLAMLLRNPNISHAPLQLRPYSALLVSFIAETVSIWQNSGRFNHDRDTLESCQGQVEALMDEYSRFWSALQEGGLIDRAEERPLLDGNTITTLLGCHPRQIPTIQTFVLCWQFDTKPAASAEDHAQLEQQCSAWLKSEWDQGRIVPLDQRLAPLSAPKGDKTKKKGVATADQDRRKRQKSE